MNCIWVNPDTDLTYKFSQEKCVIVPKKFILALCCSVGVAMPLAVMAQMPSQSPSGMSAPRGMMKPPHKMPSTVKPATATATKTSINTATLKELVKLNGIGTITAKKIMASRPYASLDELVTKKVLTKKQFTQLESKIAL